MVRHALENWPRQDLKKIAIAVHGRKASSIGSSGARRVKVIEIGAIPHDLKKLGKCAATFR
jgi:hypothetical protein